MKRSANTNPVLISVYVESPSSPSSQKPNHPATKIKPKSFPENPQIIPRTDGYDRRAQLLAYAREMRTSGGSPPAAQQTEHKKSKWSQAGPKKFRICLDQILRRRSKSRRYERLGSDNDEERSATPERANQRSKTPFYRKFSRVLRKLSCGWKCTKGLS